MAALRLLVILGTMPAVFGSFCGQTAIPFTFQALRSGQPVLGCARPKCFGYTTNGTQAGEPAQFYRVNGKEDGYMRRTDDAAAPRGNGAEPQVAACAMSYSHNNCGTGQWVGGIAPQPDTRGSLPIRCCSYGPLLQSEDRGIAVVKPGQLVVGGEVSVDGRVVAFDYISDITRSVGVDGSPEYSVGIRRMSCFDDPINTLPSGPVFQSSASSRVQPDPAPQVPTDLSLQNLVVEPPAGPRPTKRRLFDRKTQNLYQAPTEAPQQPQPEQTAQAREYNPFTAPATPSTPPQQQYQQQQYQQPRLGMTQQYQQAQQIPTGGQQYQQQNYYPQQQQQQQQPNQNYYSGVSNQQYNGNPTSGAQHVPTSVVSPYPAQNMQIGSPLGQPQYPAQQQQGAYPAGVQPIQQGGQGFDPLIQQQQQLLANMAGMRALGVAPQQIPDPLPLTMAPLQLPKLEDIPKITIPSVEDVENSIPPMQRAILTTVAKFFGVL